MRSWKKPSSSQLKNVWSFSGAVGAASFTPSGEKIETIVIVAGHEDGDVDVVSELAISLGDKDKSSFV